MQQALILSAVRTPVGSFGGALKDVPVTTLGALVIREALLACAAPAQDVDEVLMGNVLQAGVGLSPARLASLEAGLPAAVPATTVNKVCGSGLKSVALAAQAVMLGDADLVVAGGMENMSRAPFLLHDARWGYRMGNGELVDSMIKDGLWDSSLGYHMGVTAENIAERHGISRQEQDAFATASQRKCADAQAAGRFGDEIIPVEVPQRKGPPEVFDVDEFPKPQTTEEVLAKLKPAFKPDGTVTAGNSSGINDGAGAVVVASERKAKELGVQPMASIRAWASAGVEPEVMGLGPVAASERVREKAKLSLDDLDLIELNEAFAAQAIAGNRLLGLDESKVNVNGGAIALGHPIGASGTRILVTLLHEMRRRGARRGLATLCIGGGMGIALVVEA